MCFISNMCVDSLQCSDRYLILKYFNEMKFKRLLYGKVVLKFFPKYQLLLILKHVAKTLKWHFKENLEDVFPG